MASSAEASHSFTPIGQADAMDYGQIDATDGYFIASAALSTFEVDRYPLDGGAPIKLTAPGGGINSNRATVTSADGSRSVVNTDKGMFLVDWATASLSPITPTNHGQALSHLSVANAMSGDGAHLIIASIVQSGSKAYCDFFRLDLPSAQLTFLLQDYEVDPAVFSDDLPDVCHSRTLTAMSAAGDMALYLEGGNHADDPALGTALMNTSSGATTHLSSGVADVLAARFDGDQLTYVGTDFGARRTLHRVNLPTAVDTETGLPDGLSSVSLGAYGDTMLAITSEELTSDDTNQTLDLYLFSGPTLTPELVTDSDVAFRGFGFTNEAQGLSPDGRFLAYNEYICTKDARCASSSYDSVTFRVERVTSAQTPCADGGHWDGITITAPADCAEVPGDDTGVAHLELSALTEDPPASIAVAGDGVACSPDSEPDADLAKISCTVSAPLGTARHEVSGTFTDGHGSTTRTWTIVPASAPGRALRIAVMGDSYISGEGTLGPYVDNRGINTDVHSSDPSTKDLCHRSPKSWGYQVAIGETTSDNILFTACSGATTNDVRNGQYNERHGTTGTQLEQLQAFAAAGPVDVVLISIGGNDADFGGLIKECLWSNCASASYKSLAAARVENAGLQVAALLEDVKHIVGSGKQIYLVGYPSPITPPEDECAGFRLPPSVIAKASAALGPAGALAVSSYLGSRHLDVNERRWVYSSFIPNLIDAVHAAADDAGVQFVDQRHALDNDGVCGDGVNGFVPGDDQGIPDGRVPSALQLVGNESFHPTELGQLKRAADFRAQLSNRSALGAAVPTSAAAASTPTGGPITISPSVDEATYGAWGDELKWTVTAPDGTQVFAVGYSLPTTGPMVTIAGGSGIVRWTVPEGLYPGTHQIDIMTAEGGFLGTRELIVEAPAGCATGDGDVDIDKDGLADRCDSDRADGPLADADGDGVRNVDDNCPTVANAGQEDRNANSYGDVCDPDLMPWGPQQLPGDLGAPPRATADHFTVQKGRTLTVAAPGVLSNDSGEGALAAELVTAPTKGSLSLGADGSVRYTPDRAESGQDVFQYRAVDTHGHAVLTDVRIDVASPPCTTMRCRLTAFFEWLRQLIQSLLHVRR